MKSSLSGTMNFLFKRGKKTELKELLFGEDREVLLGISVSTTVNADVPSKSQRQFSGVGVPGEEYQFGGVF